ncbi:MAG: patatin-like phospholipase family protein [Acidimicrobiales bacterium]
MTRALVLGGGGPVGIGWESGLAVGLASQGVDIAASDSVYGTSAGSFVGAQLALGLDIAETVTRLAETRAATAPNEGSNSAMAERMQALMAAITEAALSDAPPEEARQALGRLALEAEVPSEEEFLGYFAVLEGLEFPEHFGCTAVDAESGEFVVWRNGSDADLWHAVASSCSVPCVFPPVTIGGRRYVDGGMRSALNADIAVGHDRALVVSCTLLALPEGMSNPLFDALMGGMADEMRTLEASGVAVETITPSQEFLEISGWGTALMDITKASDAYDAGIRQGVEESERIAAHWNM